MHPPISSVLLPLALALLRLISAQLTPNTILYTNCRFCEELSTCTSNHPFVHLDEGRAYQLEGPAERARVGRGHELHVASQRQGRHPAGQRRLQRLVLLYPPSPRLWAFDETVTCTYVCLKLCADSCAKVAKDPLE
ncbi:hypothetical protein DL766_001640 [Monosporascus sp. MC13-8B]|uniref:Secreted protein n=1 Tax=Monosporascus cannonballus TaxID=155416 RepID=A0ABY0GVF9_9PEZI|nr:hypothetical protein DL762_008800 [Monosporascus cannonballus]RYO81131.1 hypothetical protein DL763_008676 [Monosporascus cannonballus]RYP37171.1 hypothetical protein DL766_001640 [Monosporascus sp. MC13-8B]